jgi:chloramphenicol 3-O phosphotransferase
VISDVEVRDAGPKGRGVYALRSFERGEFIFRRRHTRVVTATELPALSEWERIHLCQLDLDRYAVLAPPGCYLNHSCDPSAIRHGVTVFAWRDINRGEEVTLDYRLNAFAGDSWPCDCGSATCSGVVEGDFFDMDPGRQALLLSHAPAFIRREYRRRHGDPSAAAAGSVIVLSGPSSAGKSTLAAALQKLFSAEDECWFIFGIDDYFAKVPFDWVTARGHVGPHADDGVVLEIVDGEFRMRLGPIGRRMLAAWRGGVGSAARAGLNVIADDVQLTEEEWRAWRAELRGIDCHWVRVAIDVDILEERERQRGDRTPGQARAQYEAAYRFPAFDAEVDTGRLSPDDGAAAVLAGWRRRQPVSRRIRTSRRDERAE